MSSVNHFKNMSPNNILYPPITQLGYGGKKSLTPKKSLSLSLVKTNEYRFLSPLYMMRLRLFLKGNRVYYE